MMRAGGRVARWGAPAVLWGLALFFYQDVLFTSRFIFPWDVVEFFYPYLSFVHEELRHFRFPFWNPYAMSGFPIVGDLEAQIFYPINWLFVLVHPFSPLPYKLVEIQVILHFFLAGLFMYYLAREFVPSRLAALFGGILYMFSGAMVMHTQHLASINSQAWYPLVFLLARRGLLQKRYLYAASAGMVLGVEILAGHWQHSVYLGLLLFLYFAYEACWGPRRRQLWPHWIYMLSVIGGLGALLAMVQIIPTQELGSLSVRRDVNYLEITTGNAPNFLWTLFLPNLFGGLHGVPEWYPYDLMIYRYVFLTVPGCFLALVGLIETLRRRNFFWCGLVLLTVELSFGSHGYLAAVIYHTPILNLFRIMAVFFDLANFGLCLLAAVGAETLFSRDLSPTYRRYLCTGLFLFLLLAFGLGMVLGFGGWIAGWHHMLASVAALGLMVAAMSSQKLRPGIWPWAVLALTVFELFFYNMNQKFNRADGDPGKYLSREYAVGRKESLEFLRSDSAGGFRVAAIAESQWNGGGWNVWRIPGVYGWNQIALRRYEDYIRQFTRTALPAVPAFGADHNLDSAMLDLLGVEYLVLVDALISQGIKLNHSGKFELVYQDQGWWKTYRNREYLSRAWFYPRAAAVANADQALALMNSSWFHPRRTLLLESKDIGRKATNSVEEISVIPLRLGDASNGSLTTDRNCAEGLPAFTGWGAKGNSIRYEVPRSAQPGSYLLLLRYTANQNPAPSLRVTVENGAPTQQYGPVSLPPTTGFVLGAQDYWWFCRRWRTAELGELEIAPGQNRITITSELNSSVRIYSLWLVHVPSLATPDPAEFSFDNFSASANRISLDSTTSQEGFVLLNEIYYPGWEATVDGKPAEILQADSIFRALWVPAGRHHIEMVFRPRHFWWGATVSILTLLGFVAYWWSDRRKKGFKGFAST